MMHFGQFLILALVSCNLWALDNANLKTIITNVETKSGELRTEIHFAEKDISVARRAEEIIKKDLTRAVDYFQFVPRDIIHFNIDPYRRVTNGNATIFPTNIINLYNFPASNLEHLITLEDWLQGLMFHEFFHIIHMDQTRGYLEVGRHLFGTIAKVPAGLVPRWFTEGVAVWAESHFLQGGRLQNELLNKDLWIQFKSKNFCKTIDCLDEPGVYPRGQLAYWAGGHFMNYLENKKANTIKCLIEENSHEVPFFLNTPFEVCTGQTAAELFNEFREDYLIQYSPKPEISEIPENVFGAVDYQKGELRSAEYLLHVELKKNTSALVRYDLKNKTNKIHFFHDSIDHISEVVKLENRPEGVLIAFNDDPNFIHHNKVWKIINTETLEEIKRLEIPHDPSYVILLAENDFLSFSYEENHWRAYHNDQLLKEWPIKYNIVGVQKESEKITIKMNTAFSGTALYSADLNLEKITKDGSIETFSEELPRSDEGVQSYPRLEHLIPHYWFLAVGNSNSPSSIGAMTSLSDPLLVHNLSLTALVYPNVGQMGGTAQYTHIDHFAKQIWSQFLLLSQDYSLNSWSDILNRTNDLMVGTAYQIEMRKWLYTPQINLGKSATEDAFSTQKNTFGSLLQTLSYQAMSVNDFYQTFATTFELGSVATNQGITYSKIQSRFNFTANITDDFSINLKSSYGKLNKKRFTDGVLYGGGIDQTQIVRRFEFYGIPYGDAYGNQLFSFKLMGDLNVWNIYKGRNFIPLYFKEAHLIFGAEELAADRIYIDNKFFRNEKIESFFIGSKITTNMFYFVPTSINLIFSNTRTPVGKYTSLVNFYLKSDL